MCVKHLLHLMIPQTHRWVGAVLYSTVQIDGTNIPWESLKALNCRMDWTKTAVFEADMCLFDMPARLVQSQNPWSMKIYGIWWPDLLHHCLSFGWSVDRKCRWRILLFVWWFLWEPPGRDRCSHLRWLRAPGGGRTQRGHNQIGDCNGWSTINLAKRVFFFILILIWI